jgi:hypothetical protein
MPEQSMRIRFTDTSFYSFGAGAAAGAGNGAWNGCPARALDTAGQ